MNAKFAVALILALQVSMSLCEIAAPTQELVDKYEEMKTTFVKRLVKLYEEARAATAPLVQQAGDMQQGSQVREYVEDLQAKPEFQSFVKFVTACLEEASPLVTKARLTTLGAYEHYLRPHVGEALSQAIDQMKVHLDKYLPAE
uniref:apolipoprotein A-II n=1 Tax=Semicossyphus pulcher TaxID=241346 RepID=UPI0037E72DB9